MKFESVENAANIRKELANLVKILETRDKQEYWDAAPEEVNNLMRS